MALVVFSNTFFVEGEVAKAIYSVGGIIILAMGLED
jgi:hypothetical protein